MLKLRKNFLGWSLFLICAAGITLIISEGKPSAQTSNLRLLWNQTGETTENYQYKIYLDGSVTGAVLAGVVCTGEACSAPLPTVAAGPHTLQLSALNGELESAKSAAVTFGIPTAPSGLRVVSSGGQ